jgi:outer membrane protein
MSIITNRILRFTLLFLSCFAGFAAQAGDTNKSVFITMDSAVAMGISHSHQVQLSSSQLAEVHSSVLDIKNRAIPSIALSAGYTRLSDVPIEYFLIPGSPEAIPSTALFPIILNNYSATASLQESVFNGFLLKNANVNMQYTEKSAEYSLESKKNNVKMDVITNYLTLFKLQQAHLLIEESLQQIASHVKEVGDFAKDGLATENDLLRVKLDQSNTQLNEIDIENQLLTVNYNMNVMLGLNGTTSIKVDSASISGSKTIQPLPYYIQKSSENRNDIQASDMQQKAAEVAIKETQSELYPKISILADYDYLRPNPRLVPPIDQFNGSWDLGIRITYNLTDLYSNKNKADVSRARYAEAQAQFAELSDNVKMEINQNYLEYQQSLQKIEVANKSLTQAQENYKLVKSRYDNHVALLTDLMDANNYLLNAKINLVSANADAQLAYYKLLKSAGELNTKK